MTARSYAGHEADWHITTPSAPDRVRRATGKERAELARLTIEAEMDAARRRIRALAAADLDAKLKQAAVCLQNNFDQAPQCAGQLSPRQDTPRGVGRVLGGRA